MNYGEVHILGHVQRIAGAVFEGGCVIVDVQNVYDYGGGIGFSASRVPQVDRQHVSVSGFSIQRFFQHDRVILFAQRERVIHVLGDHLEFHGVRATCNATENYDYGISRCNWLGLTMAKSNYCSLKSAVAYQAIIASNWF